MLKKRRKKKRLDAVTQSQKGALDLVVVKKSETNSENQTLVENAVEGEAHTAEFYEGDDGNSSDKCADPSTE